MVWIIPRIRKMKAAFYFGFRLHCSAASVWICTAKGRRLANKTFLIYIFPEKTDTPARPAACPFSVRKIRGSGFQPGALRSYLPGWLPLLFVTLIILFSLTEIYRRTQISLPNPSKWPFHYANKCILCKILYIFSPFGSKRISSLSTPRIKKSTTA